MEVQLANLENEIVGSTVQVDALLQQWKVQKTLQLVEFNEAEEVLIPENNPDHTAENEQVQREVITSDSESVVKHAIHIANSVEAIPGFLETAEYFRKKADRLDGQEFTVALFGAFSAGKSSFSNALIGENVLPVSPNPTTAAINRIRPVSVGKEDKTADILLKTEDRMTEDVFRSFEALGIVATSLD